MFADPFRGSHELYIFVPIISICPRSGSCDPTVKPGLDFYYVVPASGERVKPLEGKFCVSAPFKGGPMTDSLVFYRSDPGK